MEPTDDPSNLVAFVEAWLAALADPERRRDAWARWDPAPRRLIIEIANQDDTRADRLETIADFASDHPKHPNFHYFLDDFAETLLVDVCPDAIAGAGRWLEPEIHGAESMAVRFVPDDPTSLVEVFIVRYHDDGWRLCAIAHEHRR